MTATTVTPTRAAALNKPKSKTTLWLQSFLLRWVVLIVLLVVWQVATTLWPSAYFPQPILIFQHAAALWLPGENGLLTPGLINDVLPSLGRMLLGFSASVILGVTFGVIIGLSKVFDEYVDWVLQFLRAVPPPLLFPVFLVVFGTGDEMRVALIAFGTVWPILLNTIDGVRSVEPLKYETSKVFQIRPADKLTRIILPAAAPKIFAGIRTSLALALILMVISEMVAASSGIGFQLVQAQRGFAILTMWAGILLLAVLGFLLNLLLNLVERRVLAWQRFGGKETS